MSANRLDPLWTERRRRILVAPINDYGNRISYAQYAEPFSQLKLPIRFKPPRPNFEPRGEICPSELAPLAHITTDGSELSQLRWGLVARADAEPVINIRIANRFRAYRLTIVQHRRVQVD